MKIVKLVLKIFFVLVLLILLAFRVYVKCREVKVDSDKLEAETNVHLSQKQTEIACFVISGQKNPAFEKSLFLLKDIVSNRNKAAYYTAAEYLSQHYPIRCAGTTERRIIYLATERYVIKTYDYQTCYDYLFSQSYFGNGIYGLPSAADFYYQKSYESLTEKEFISLCLLQMNSAYYDFLDDDKKDRCRREVDRIYRELLE